MTDKRNYTKAEVAGALDVVVAVTLRRVREAIQEVTYGVVDGKDEQDVPIIRQVVDWSDVEKAITELEDKSDD